MTERIVPHQRIRYLPHQRERRITAHGNVDIAIIHAMAETITVSEPAGTYSAWEWLERLRLSAHVLCAPDGSLTITVPWDRTAYHAGISALGSRRDLNDSSLGVELLVAGVHDYPSFLQAIGVGRDALMDDPYTAEQYNAVGYLVASWQREYPAILQDRILGHGDVSGREVRPTDPKHDPGPLFDWPRFHEARLHWQTWFRDQGAT